MADRLRVLLAESDASAARAIGSLLRERGIEVFGANDAAHAINMARKEKPDAVVVNARLAGGAEAALRRLRSNVFTAHIPVIALAEAGAQSAQMTAAGAQACLAPLPGVADLEAAIRKNLLQDLDFTQAPAQELESPERMEDLRDSGLLDSAPEKTFDVLTRLAASLCGAPAALVTLVDKDRQFFKSQVGLAEPWAGQRQTRLSHSFCQWVVTGQESVVVGDATEHPVLKSNLAVRDLGVIAYAGMPIQGRGGQTIGSFCAIDSKPRQWTEEALATLRDLARIAQGYAALSRARESQGSARGADAGANLRTSAHVAGNAILGAASILKRRAGQLPREESDALLEIVMEHAAHLARAT